MQNSDILLLSNSNSFNVVIMFIFRADYSVAHSGNGRLALLVFLATPPKNGAVSIGMAFGIPEA